MRQKSSWRGYARLLAPGRLREWAASGKLRRPRQRNAGRSAEEVFSEVYAQGQWGDGFWFDSGSGSTGQPAEAYQRFIRELIEETGVRTAVDIGCGDFRVASGFADALDSYHGVDVVPSLIERNSKAFERPGLRFSTLDAAREPLPDAQLCLIRQVLQHLSNTQISNILSQCHRYALVVVTEHWPASTAMRLPNVDKPHGPDTRLDKGSWVDISAAPFSCSPVEERLRASPGSPLYRAGESIRTHLWRP